MAQGDVVPVLTAENCRQKLPVWGVTREFRFGQFVRLYDERVISGVRHVTPLVLTADGDIVETSSGLMARTSSSNAATGVPLHVVAAQADIDRLVVGTPDAAVQVVDPERVVQDGVVRVDGTDLRVELGAQAASQLRAGRPVTTLARKSEGEATMLLRLEPAVVEAPLDAARLDRALAERRLQLDGGRVDLDSETMRSLMRGDRVVAPLVSEGRVVGQALLTTQQEGDVALKPVAERFVIEDLAEFLAIPIVPATTGESIVLAMPPEAVGSLRRDGRVTVQAAGRAIQLVARQPAPADPIEDGVVLNPAKLREPFDLAIRDPRAARFDPYRYRRDFDVAQGQGTATTNPPSVAPQLAREGLPIALLLPWKQQWVLQGFSRGNLLSTIALAPGEETTITVSSWERRIKSLQQTAETNIEQNFDFSSTARDTEDVFTEVARSNDFTAQARGELDASYSNGVASVRIGAGGEISNAQSLTNTVRNSSQHLRESTSRASTRVTARRVTTITESIEVENRTSVVRRIRNPNACHTLTLNFHEALAHYAIQTAFIKSNVRIVVLIPNPCPVTNFTEIVVRMHETTLRLALLEPSLADGIDACRYLKSYQFAEGELRRLAGLSKQEKEQDRERTQPPPNTSKPSNPQLAPLLSILATLKEKAASLAQSDVTGALDAIANHRSVTPAVRLSAQRWLWSRLVATKFGLGLLEELARLAKVVEPTADDARRVLGAAPPTGAYPSLDGLGSLSDQEKEDAGLAARIKSMPGFAAADWGLFWYPNAKKEQLYDVADGGIPGALAQLKTTFQAWETKASEGEGVQAAQAAVAQANEQQSQATLADRLELKFGADQVGEAYERREALLAHLEAHRDYYRYVLFQALPPSEQLQQLLLAAPQLRVGLFEPHVVACDGPNLAVPLSPLGETTLEKVVNNLAQLCEEAAAAAQAAGEAIASDHVILPTPGLSVESWLGECSGCEAHLESLRAAEVRSVVASARRAELEADRLQARLAANQLEDPSPQLSPRLQVHVDGELPRADPVP